MRAPISIHSFRCIYVTRAIPDGVPVDAIKDMLGIDEKTLKYYIKAPRREISILDRVVEDILGRITAVENGQAEIRGQSVSLTVRSLR